MSLPNISTIDGLGLIIHVSLLHDRSVHRFRRNGDADLESSVTAPQSCFRARRLLDVLDKKLPPPLLNRYHELNEPLQSKFLRRHCHARDRPYIIAALRTF